MKVLFAPDWRAGVPYQQLLASALAKQGVEVIFPKHTHGLFRLSKAVKAAGDFDILHIHWSEAYFAKVGDKRDFLRRFLFPWDLKNAIKNKPVIYTAHNLFPHATSSGAAPQKIERAVARNVTEVVRQSQRVIVHSLAAADLLAHTFGINKALCQVIPMGDLSDGLPPLPDKAAARARLGIGQAPVCLMLGMADPYKGIELVIERFKTVGEKNIQLAIVGKPISPAYAESIQARLKAVPNSIARLERVSDVEMMDWMAAADVMLFNYKNILTSGAAGFARSLGVPIALSKRLNTVDLLEPCANVVRFDDNAQSMLAAVRQAMGVGHLAQEAAQFRAACNWDAIAQKTASVYHCALKQKGNSSCAA